MLQVTEKTNPFHPEARAVTHAPGTSLADIVEAARERSPVSVTGSLAVICDGRLVEPHLWRARPKPGSVIEIVALPTGNQQTLGIVLSVAVIALAVGTGGLAAAALGPGAGGLVGAGLLSAKGALIAGAVVTSAVGVVGSLAVSALAPPPSPGLGSSAQSQPLATLEGASNGIRLRSPVPINFGQNKVVPQLAAQTLNEGSGRDAYLRALFLWGYGEIELDRLKIGQTPINRFEAVVRSDLGADRGAVPYFSIFPFDTFVRGINAEVSQAGGAVQRSTEADTTEFVVYLAFFEGLHRFSKNGKDATELSVTIRIEYAPVGTSAWVKVTGDDITITRKTLDPFRLVYSQDVAKGQYNVRVRRVTGDYDESRLRSKFQFQQLFSANGDVSPINVKGVAGTAMRLKASERLQGRLDEVSGRIRSVILDWDAATQTWIKRPTRNPASCFRYALQGPHCRAPLTDAQIDLAALQEWHEWCDEMGFSCDLYVDFDATLGEVLSLISAAGLAAWDNPAGIYTVVVDRPRPEIIQQWTPRNIKSFQASKIFGRPVHALRGKFRNRGADYREDDVTVYAPGYDEDSAVEIDELELDYVTDPTQAWRITQHRLGERLFRSMMYRIQVGWDWLRCRVGDRVRLGHDGVLIGAGGGRIKQLTLNDTNSGIKIITLDSKVLLGPGIQYGMDVRYSDGTMANYAIASTPGDIDTFVLESAIPIDAGVKVGDIAWIGARGIETMDCLVRKIAPGFDDTAEVELVPYAPELFDLQDGLPDEIPSFVTPIAQAQTPTISRVVSDETTAIRQPDGSITVRVVVAIFEIGSRPLTLIEALQVRYRETDSSGSFRVVTVPADEDIVSISEVQAGSEIEVQARYVYRGGTPSDWSDSVIHEVVAATFPPGPIEALYQDGDFVRWEYAPPPDHLGYIVRQSQASGVAWEDAASAHSGLITETFFSIDLLSVDTTHVQVKAVSIGGLESDQSLEIEINRELVTARAEAARFPYAPDFVGDIEGGSVVDGILTALDTGVFIPDPGAPLIPFPGLPFIEQSYDRVRYTIRYPVPSTVREGYRVRLDVLANAGYLVVFRAVDDIVVGSSDLDDTLPDPDDSLLDLSLPYPTGEIGDTSRKLRPWPGYVPAVPGQILEFQLIGYAADKPFELQQFDIILDAPPVTEIVDNIYIPVEGRTLPYTKDFEGFTGQWFTIRQDGTGERQAVVIRKSVVTGSEPPAPPFLRAYDQFNQPVEANVSALIMGYGGNLIVGLIDNGGGTGEQGGGETDPTIDEFIFTEPMAYNDL